MNTESVRFASGMNIMLALWLIFSPFILGYATNGLALWNAVIVGLIILTLAWVRMLRPSHWLMLSWVNLLLSVWLTVSPFLLGIAADNTAKWNDIIVGLSILCFAGVGLLNAPRIEV